VLPRALTCASHDEKVAATHVEGQRASAAGGAQEKTPPGPEPHDGDDGVIARDPEPVAVEGHAVTAISVGGERHLRERASVASRERGGKVRDQRMPRTILREARHEAGHVDDPVIHAPAMRFPTRGRPEHL